MTVLAQISEYSSVLKDNDEVIKPLELHSYKAIYELKKINNKWFISCYQPLKEDDENKCKVVLEDLDPCP